jgi:hypothetical protein
MIDPVAVRKTAAALGAVAARSILGTLLVVCAAGAVLAAGSAYFLRDHPLYAAVAAVLALAESVGAGVVLGVKRALILTAAHGLERTRLGRAAVRMVFERLLTPAEGEGPAGPGAWAAGQAERLPLAQAEQRLSYAVTSVRAAGPARGFAGRVGDRIQERVLGLVKEVTLARFRAEGAKEGGIEVRRIQTDLEERVDSLLIGRLRKGLNLWTLLVVVGLPFSVFAQTWLAIMLLNAK